jgi:hypothetical protein
VKQVVATYTRRLRVALRLRDWLEEVRAAEITKGGVPARAGRRGGAQEISERDLEVKA